MSSPSAPPTDQPSPDRLSGESSDAIDLTSGGPPPELIEQMARADEINSRLREGGREICFALSSDGRALQIELRDSRNGALMRTISLTEAIELAEGGLPE
jgi:hypothetical protein